MNATNRNPIVVCLPLALVLLLGLVSGAGADYKLGRQFFMARQYEDALREFQKQCEMTPDFHYSRYMLGICLLKLNKLDDATIKLEESLVFAETDKEKFNTFDGLGKVYAAKRDYEKAVGKFKEASALQVDTKRVAKANEQMGDSYLKMKDFKAAESAFAKSATLLPADKDVQYKLGVVRLSLRNFDGAIAALEKAHSLDPKNVKWMVRLGDALMARALRTNDNKLKETYYRKGVALAREGLAADSKSFEMNELLGNSYLGLRQYDEAIGVLSTAVSLRPQYGYAYYNLAQAYTVKSDYSQAEKSLSTARTLMPKNAAVFSSLGFVYEKQKRLQDSRKAYEVAYDLQPSSFNKKNLDRVVENIKIRDQNQSIEQDNQGIDKLNQLIEQQNRLIEMENLEAERINELIEQEFGEEPKEDKDK